MYLCENEMSTYVNYIDLNRAMFYLGFYVILVVCFCVEVLMDDSVRTRYMGNRYCKKYMPLSCQHTVYLNRAVCPTSMQFPPFIECYTT